MGIHEANKKHFEWWFERIVLRIKKGKVISHLYES